MKKLLELLKAIYNDIKYIWKRNGIRFLMLSMRNYFSPIKGSSKLFFHNYWLSFPHVQSFLAQIREIFFHGIYQFKARNENPIIIDCGANIGLSCLYFKELYPKSEIIAIEANPVICKYLIHNLNSAALNDVIIISKAAWINNNGIEMNLESNDSSSIYGNGIKTKIETIDLKEYIDKFERIDLLKIDIEGAELLILEGIQQSLDKIDKLFVEYHSFSNLEQNLDRILKILNMKNFRYFIQSIGMVRSPFSKFNNKNSEMDLQLNIFAINQNPKK